MRKSLTIATLLVAFYKINAQTVVFNEQLFAQMTKNQAVRLSSNQALLNSFDKQRQIYDDINKKTAQIVAIQEYIYSQLTNVNEGIRQGKQLFYIFKTFGDIEKNANKVLNLTAKYPQYAVILYKYYEETIIELLKMKEELTRDILSESNDFLMDPYDRQKLIQTLDTRSMLVNGALVTIIIKIEDAKNTPYLYQIPVLQNYVNLDKMIVNDIMQKYKTNF